VNKVSLSVPWHNILTTVYHLYSDTISDKKTTNLSVEDVVNNKTYDLTFANGILTGCTNKTSEANIALRLAQA
jgi:hypothetical protein